MGPEDRFARYPLLIPAYLNCPVCGENHVLRTAGRVIYLECPKVDPGMVVEPADPLATAVIRRVTAAWN